MGIRRLGNKLVGSIKRFGDKHKGKILVVGAIAGGVAHGNAEFDKDGPNKRARAATKAEELMNVQEEEYNEEQQSKAKIKHDKLMADAKPAPQGKGNLQMKAKDPNILQVGMNIPKALKASEKGAKNIKDSKLLKKGKAVEGAAVDVLGQLNAPSKKQQKIVSQSQKFAAGDMSDAEAQDYINKKAGKIGKKQNKKAKKAAKKDAKAAKKAAKKGK